MKRLIGVMLFAYILIGCVKGPKGDTGPQGPAGTNGTNGNANVKAGEATILPGDWGWDNTNKLSYIDISYPAITSDIVSSGTVNVFMTNTTGTWLALPWTYWGNPSITYNYGYVQGKVSVSIQKTDNSAHNPTAKIKIVVISSAQKAAHPNTNWKNYDEAMSAINESSAARL